MKLPVIAVLVFVVALGGSAGLRIATAPAVTPDSTAVPAESDSLEHQAQATSTGTAPDSGHVVADSGHAPPPVVPDSATPVDSASKHPAPAVVRLPEAGHPRPDYPRLAKLLSAMPTALAVERITLLNDTEVEGILRALGPRQGAAILAAMPKERVAALARRLLVPRDSGAIK